MSDEQKRDLAEPVRRALDFLSDPESDCRALDMLLADGELTPLSVGLLLLQYLAKELKNNPFLDVAVQDYKIRNELEEISKKWEGKGHTNRLEEVYVLGLSALFDYIKAGLRK
jgi:hypothetical protein